MSQIPAFIETQKTMFPFIAKHGLVKDYLKFGLEAALNLSPVFTQKQPQTPIRQLTLPRQRLG